MWKIPGSLVPIVLGTVQSARNFGYWKVYHLWSRISTCIYGTLRVFTALLSLAEHGAPKYVKNRSRAPKDVVPFLCVRRFMFTWAMDHGYEIIALAAQLPEPKHAKCINADQKKTGCQVPFTNATRGPEMISANSFCGFIFTRAIDVDLDPQSCKIPEQKRRKTL